MPRLRFVLLAAAVAMGAPGCGDRGSDAVFEPVRLVGDPDIDRSAPFLTWGTVVTIADLPLPALSASEPILPAVTIQAPPGQVRTIKAQIPPQIHAVPWLVFETVVTRAGTMSRMRSWPVTGNQGGQTYEVGLVEEKVGADGVPGVRLWPVPDLAKRDVETGPVAIPAHAVLQVAIGLEPASWDTTVVPVDMTVTAIAGGTPTVLRTTQVNVRRPEDRQWIALSIPLDSIGGRTVKLRFSARPNIGPTAVPSLPVWGDPTIVDVRSAAP
jgi:hypothetical protein